MRYASSNNSVDDAVRHVQNREKEKSSDNWNWIEYFFSENFLDGK